MRMGLPELLVVLFIVGLIALAIVGLVQLLALRQTSGTSRGSPIPPPAGAGGFCSRCGRELAVSAQSCTGCGAPVPSAPVQTLSSATSEEAVGRKEPGAAQHH